MHSSVHRSAVSDGPNTSPSRNCRDLPSARSANHYGRAIAQIQTPGHFNGCVLTFLDGATEGPKHGASSAGATTCTEHYIMRDRGHRPHHATHRRELQRHGPAHQRPSVQRHGLWLESHADCDESDLARCARLVVALSRLQPQPKVLSVNTTDARYQAPTRSSAAMAERTKTTTRPIRRTWRSLTCR